jgi:two-component system phosphate regulon response regulator PhoB
MIGSAGDAELELGLPSGETVDDGEWVLAIFDIGPEHKATSAAARATIAPDGPRLVFEPRDYRRLADFAAIEANHPGAPVVRSSSRPPPPRERAMSEPDVSMMTRVTTRSWPPRSGAGARILVVDDDADIRDVVSAMLEAVGLAVTTRTSAEEALVTVQREEFDLLVFDWNLPKMTGVELCRIIRRDLDIQLPVLFLTANASSQDMVEAFASGADDYVVKPFRAPELGARIFSLLRRTARGG